MFTTAISNIDALVRSNGVEDADAGLSIGVILTAEVFVVSANARAAAGVLVAAGTFAEVAEATTATTRERGILPVQRCPP
jgi:hypothetical protein